MCKCGNQGCKVREARGLVPFCQMGRSDAPMLTREQVREELLKQIASRPAHVPFTCSWQSQ